MHSLANTILGRYLVHEQIGAGAMGVVYRASDPLLERNVAIKTIRIDVTAAEREEFKKRFFREAKSAARLNHPNIVTVYDAGESGEIAYIAMELLDGKDLRHYIRRDERPSFERTAEIVADVARALHYAHIEGVVHRDVKPGNIIVLNNGAVKLADFGIARLATGSGTQTGQTFGTPKYMAPEQIAGRPVDGRADIFALGIVLYQMLTGVAPFDGDSFSSIMFRVMQEPAVSPSELIEGLPSGFEYVLSRALAKDPNNRYQNAGQMELDLRNLALSDAAKPLPWGVGGLRSRADIQADPNSPQRAWDATELIARGAPSGSGPTPPAPSTIPLAPTEPLGGDARKTTPAAAALGGVLVGAKETRMDSTGRRPAGVEPPRNRRRTDRPGQPEPKPGEPSAVRTDAAPGARAASDKLREPPGRGNGEAGRGSRKSEGGKAAPAASSSGKTIRYGGAWSSMHWAGLGAAAVVLLVLAVVWLRDDTPSKTVSMAAVPAPPAIPAAAGSATLPAQPTAGVSADAPGAAASAGDPPSKAASSAASAAGEVPTEGKLTFAISPWGEVFINGENRGVSPPLTELSLKPGEYLVQIRNGDLKPIEQRITVEAGKRRRISAKF